MNILDQIVEHKHKEVAARKILHPINLLEQSVYFPMPVISIKQHLLSGDKSGIIAEIKRKSPSKGVINSNVSIERTSIGYVGAGASALSVLTDHHFFGGSNEDLMTARKFNACPILRKDFILEEYQIIEAKSIGADVILLIAAVLEPKKLRELCGFAHSLGLEVLMEVHNEEELRNNTGTDVDLIGVNNRNLKTFQLSIETSKELSQLIPDSAVKISESGIESPEVIMELKKHGFKGFLMGQTFMQHGRPEDAAMKFINKLNQLSDHA